MIDGVRQRRRHRRPAWPARCIYERIDQGVVDGAVNGAGLGAEDAGGLLRTIQTGRVQQYGALLFGAAALLALALVLFV